MFLRTKVTKILLSEDKNRVVWLGGGDGKAVRPHNSANQRFALWLKILFPIVVVVAQLLEFARVGFETAALGLEVEIPPYRQT